LFRSQPSVNQQGNRGQRVAEPDVSSDSDSYFIPVEHIASIPDPPDPHLKPAAAVAAVAIVAEPLPLNAGDTAPLPPNAPHPRHGLPMETATFKWKKTVYKVVEPARVKLHQCLVNFDLKCHFADKMAMAANPEEQVKLEFIRLLTRQWIIDLYTVDAKGIFDWAQLLGDLRSEHKDRLSGENVDDPGGVYVAVISDSDTLVFKFGSSFHCHRRVEEQSCKYGALYLDIGQLNEIVPHDLVQQILDVKMPRVGPSSRSRRAYQESYPSEPGGRCLGLCRRVWHRYHCGATRTAAGRPHPRRCATSPLVVSRGSNCILS
jgi:hypothetical protein